VPTAAPTRPLTGASPMVPEEPTGGRVKWLLVFRAIVVTVLLTTSLLVRASTNEDFFAEGANYLYVVAGASFASIMLGAIVLRWRPRLATAVAYSQLVADALVATALVWLTGGAESVFGFLYSLSVLNGAIVVGRRAALIMSAVSALLFAAVTMAWTGTPVSRNAFLSVLTNGASFVLVAILSGYLTAQLTRTSDRLKDARAHIIKLEELYAAVLGSLPSGVMSVGDGGDVVFANAAGREILGTPGLIGMRIEQAAPSLAPLVGRAATARFEIDVEVAGRGRRVLGGSIAPLVGIDDGGRVVVFQDLTELRRLQEDVARAERLAELGRLAAGLAHEIRNPLAAMIGCLQLLKSDNAAGTPSTADTSRLLDIVQREAERLSALVHSFLTYARPAEPRQEAIAVSSFLEETATAASHGLRMAKLTMGPVTPALVKVDSDQLRQVLWNVITNADKIGESVSKRLQVCVGAVVDGDSVVITIEDDGPGVPAELRSRIFEPFFTTRPDGNGLGLATSHQLINQNGGVMGVQTSAQLGGALFTIRLPIFEPNAASAPADTPTISR